MEHEAGSPPPEAQATDITDTPALDTGDPRVDAALADLRELAGRPVEEHPAVYERMHQRLLEVLGELDGHPPGWRPPADQVREERPRHRPRADDQSQAGQSQAGQPDGPQPPDPA